MAHSDTPFTVMTMKQCHKLKVNQEIDFRDQVGRFVHSIIEERYGSSFKIHFIGWKRRWDIYTDCDFDFSRFAIAGSISKRPAHRFSDKKIGDKLDVYPSPQLRPTHNKWHEAYIRKKDPDSGQVQVVYFADDKNYLYWTHLDNEEEVAEHLTKSTIKPPSPTIEEILRRIPSSSPRTKRRIEREIFNDDDDAYESHRQKQPMKERVMRSRDKKKKKKKKREKDERDNRRFSTYDNSHGKEEDEKEDDEIILSNLTIGERREFREAFRLFDKDDDGTITITELQEVFEGLNYHFTMEQLQIMVGTIDKDGDGQIDLDEFILMMRGKNYGDPKHKKSYIDELRDAFDVFDKDGDGNITPQELAHCLKALGENLTTEDITAMIGEADTDGDGTIDFEEFRKLMSEDHLLFQMKG